MPSPLRLLAALLGALAAAPAPAALTVEPPSVSVEPGKKTEVTIKWVFAGEPFDRLDSERGEFMALFALTPLEVVAVPLKAALVRGTGALEEKVTITAALTEAMRAQGLTRISYLRRFGSSEASVDVKLGGSRATKPSVERIELAFADGGAQATVARRGPVPAVTAVVRYQGAGVLEAAWELDGRVHARVTRTVDVLGEARFEPPELPPLPTDEPGVHRLRFVPVRTARGLTIPSLTYTVTPDGSETALAPLALAGPATDAALEYEEARLTWRRGRGALYLVDLRDCESGAGLFSTFTRESTFRLPAFGVSPHLTPGRLVCWRVTGFDDAGVAVEASEVRRLRLTYPRGAP